MEKSAEIVISKNGKCISSLHKSELKMLLQACFTKIPLSIAPEKGKMKWKYRKWMAKQDGKKGRVSKSQNTKRLFTVAASLLSLLFLYRILILSFFSARAFHFAFLHCSFFPKWNSAPQIDNSLDFSEEYLRSILYRGKMQKSTSRYVKWKTLADKHMQK